MNSEGIQPRAGMYVKTTFDNRPPKYVSFIGELVFYSNGSWGSVRLFLEGNYEILWIPPTDEERAMFRKAAEEFRAIADGGPSLHGIYDMIAENQKVHEDGTSDMCATCVGNWEEPAERFAQIADSLALDGADYDNMPEGYE